MEKKVTWINFKNPLTKSNTCGISYRLDEISLRVKAFNGVFDILEDDVNKVFHEKTRVLTLNW